MINPQSLPAANRGVGGGGSDWGVLLGTMCSFSTLEGGPMVIRAHHTTGCVCSLQELKWSSVSSSVSLVRKLWISNSAAGGEISQCTTLCFSNVLYILVGLQSVTADTEGRGGH